MGNPVIVASQLLQWVRSDYKGTYDRQYQAVNERGSMFADMSVPSNALIEYFGYALAAPHIKYWKEGENITSKPFSSVAFSVTNRHFGIRVDWSRTDRIFDRLQMIRDRAADAGRSAAMLKEKAIYQALTQATDNELFPAIQNAPDGAALFSTTDGTGANRFGVSSGNLLTGTGVATPTAIRTDFWNAIEQFRLFQDGEGYPFYDPTVLDSGFVVTYGTANDQVFREAFAQRVTQGSTGNTNAVTNIILDAGVAVTLVPTQYITDNDWFVQVKNAGKKSIFFTTPTEPEEHWATEDNSDQVRTSNQEYYQVDQYIGLGIGLSLDKIKINN
jgi:phage major head subunit gpT-like protein